MGTEKPYSKFWEINVGHIVTLTAFIFGLGVAWTKMDSKIDAVNQASISRRDDLAAITERNKRERELINSHLERRVEKLELNQVVIDDLRSSVARLTFQVDNLTTLLKEFQLEIKALRAQRITGNE